MKRIFTNFAKIIGFLLLTTITATAFWYAWQNWTGAREWKKTRELLADEGIELDLQKYEPPMPSEDENFARTPLIAAVTDLKFGPRGQYYDNPELVERFGEIQLPSMVGIDSYPSWKTGEPANLDEISKIIVEETGVDRDILVWMEQFSEELVAIDAASKLPKNQLPVHLPDNFVDLISLPLPYVSKFTKFQIFQGIRACAALREGDNVQARAALRTSLQLHRTVESHPTLISYVVGLSMLDRSLSIVWEGLEAGLWTEKDLLWIQDELDTLSVLPDLEEALVFNMVAYQIGAGNFMKSIRGEDARKLVGAIAEIDQDPFEYESLGWMAQVAPAGYWDHNLSYGVHATLEEIIRPVRERRIPNPDLSRAYTDIRNPQGRDNAHSLHNLLVYETILASFGNFSRSFESAIAVDLARVACAVELYRIDYGEYPPAADSLVPIFIEKIPEDIFDPGKPLKYAKGAQGDRYRIYSVGKNGTDEQGEVAFAAEGKWSRRDLDKGDWAWGYSYPERRK